MTLSLADPIAPAEEAPGFARLRRVLASAVRLADDDARKRVARTVRMALHAVAFERAALNVAVAATTRLAHLAALQKLVGETDLMARDREEAALEIDRAAVRILWSERIVEIVLESDAQAVTRAAALLSLVARGIVPAGAAARALLEPAKALLDCEAARDALTASPVLREQMIDLLAAAEAA
jgi:hypothetical protein